MILPITWYHYPVALMPFGIAASRGWRRASSVAHRPLVVAAVVVASLSIAWLPALWIAVALLVAAVATSGSASACTQPR